jgi:hypothetical protein
MVSWIGKIEGVFADGAVEEEAAGGAFGAG